MKKLLLSLCLLAPCLAGAQIDAPCNAYIEDQALSDGTHRFASLHEIITPMNGDLMTRMGVYVEMGNYRHSFRIHIRTLQGTGYIGNARNLIFVFGDDSRMDYPLTVKRDNNEWVAEFSGRDPEKDLLQALRTRTLKAIRLTSPMGVDETHVVTIPERYVESLMKSIDCLAGMMR